MDLKSFREDKLKITQAEFAELIGVEQSSISKWEQDIRNPDIYTIVKMCKFFNVSADYFLGLED